MKVDVINIQGSSTGRQVDLTDSIFDVQVNDHAIYLAVKQYLANQRQGTHKAKERGEVKGSTRKIKKQKGTGTARFGDIKNPLFRGGGRVFGPRPRNYGFKLNKKVKQLARASALTYKVKEDGLKVIENLKFDVPKTKEFAEVLKGIGADGMRSLIVIGESDHNLIKSASNLPKTKVVPAASLNTYDILNAGVLILSEDAVKHFSS